MKYKMISKDKTDYASREFQGFIIDADSLDEAYEKMHQLKGTRCYPTADDFDLVEYEEKRGRPKFEKSSKKTHFFPDDLYDKIPGKKAEYIRDAVKMRLEKDGISY